MNIFHKVALQSLLKNRVQTFVTIIGVLLSTAMFTAVATFGTSLVDYLIRTEIAKGGNWHIQFSDVSHEAMDALVCEEEIAQAVSYQNLGYALLAGAQETSAGKPYLFIAGFDEEAFQALPVRMISGRLPEREDEVLVPDHIALKAGVRIPLGSELSLDIGQRTADGEILTQCSPYSPRESLIPAEKKTYTVVGTYARPEFELHESAGYTLITRDWGEMKEDAKGTLMSSGETEGTQAARYTVLLALKNPRFVQAYGENKKEIGPYALNEKLLRFMGITDNRLFNLFLYTVGGVLAAIIMTGSIFLIYNSFYISLGERVHQFGILMSVGATKRQLCGSVVFEGLCIGSVGIPLGILAGIGSVRVLLPLVERAFYGAMGDQASLKLSVALPALAASAVLSLVTILLSAYLPVRKAASMPVMACIRQTGELQVDARAVRTPRFLWRLLGLEGTLALKNFKRNKKRYRSVVLSLTLSVVLAVSGNAFGSTLKRISTKLLSQSADGDILFSVQDMTEDTFIRLYEKMKTAEGVEKSTWQRDCFFSGITDELPEDFLAEYRQAMGDPGTGSVQPIVLEAQFIEDDLYFAFVESLGLPAEEFCGEEGKVLVCGINSSENATYFAGTSMNFTLVAPSGEQTKEICAVFQESYPIDTGYVQRAEDVPAYVFLMTAPLSAKPWFYPVEDTTKPSHLGATFWSHAPSQTLSRLEALLMEEKVMTDYTLIDLSAAFGLFRNLNFVVDLFTVVFVTMISLIAVANVFNTISTNVRLRRRELAMLRSVGMSDRGFRRMMNVECAFYGIRTLVYSIPLASASAWLIHKILISIEELDDMAFAFPWGAMGCSILGVFGIVFLTMLYAMDRIRRENIIDVLRDDMA